MNADRGAETSLPAVAGVCPMGCGRTLVLLCTGQVMCDGTGCPRPFAAAEILADTQTEHVVDLAGASFTVRHPLRERLDDALLTCTLPAHLTRLDGPLLARGTYQVTPGARGWDDATWTPIDRSTS